MQQRLNVQGVVLQALKYCSLLLATLVVLIPPYTIVVNAFKSSKEYISTSAFALPESFFNFGNFTRVFEIGKLIPSFGNIVYIIFFSLLFNVLLGSMVAYAVGRFNFKFKNVILGLYLGATFIPTITTQVATFGVIKGLGLFNTKWAAILLYSGADVVQIYLFLQFIRTIPYALDESAMIEGASLFRIYRTIIVPLLTPAFATTIILKTIAIYNDLYTPWLYMPSQRLSVISTALLRFAGPHSAQWELICAAILIVLVPTGLLYLILQRFIFNGIVTGSVKE